MFGDGGETPTNQNVIDFITIETAGNAADFGDLVAAGSDVSGCGSFTRAIFYGARTPSITDSIQYVAFDSTGNCADFGNLTQARSYAGSNGGGNNSRSIMTSGSNGSQYNTIDFINPASLGNATDFGDLQQVKYSVATSSNNCLLYTSPSPRDGLLSRMPSSA